MTNSSLNSWQKAKTSPRRPAKCATDRKVKAWSARPWQNVENAKGVVRVIILGGADMPPIGAKFSDRELAAVVTYVRNSWGNKYGLVTEEQARKLRP